MREIGLEELGYVVGVLREGLSLPLMIDYMIVQRSLRARKDSMVEVRQVMESRVLW